MSSNRHAHHAVRAFLVASLLTAAPRAHLKFPTVRGERLVELELGQAPIRLGYRVGFGAELAARERKAADRDGDGQVSTAEGNAVLDARTSALLAALRVCVGRSLSELTCRELARRDVESMEVDGWAPDPSGHMHFAWTLRLAESARELGAIRIEDGYDVPGVELSEVQIDPPGHTPLSLAGEGGRTEGVVERVTFIEARRASGPRVAIAQWAPPAEHLWRSLGVAAAVIAFSALLLGLRARRRAE